MVERIVIRPDPHRFVVNRIALALLIGGAVATVVSRPLVAYAGVPAEANYLHFAGVVLAAMLLMSPRNVHVAVEVRTFLALYLTATVVSWLWNGGQSLFAVVLSWLVMAEPLIVIAAAAELVRRGFSPYYFELTAIALVLSQLPFAMIQLARYGIGDPVQGLLVQQGAGHHVFGFMAIVLAVWALGRIVAGNSSELWKEFALLSIGFVAGVITDTKQGVAGFVAVSALLVLARNRNSPQVNMARRLFAVVTVGALVAVGIQLNASSSEMGNVDRRDNFLEVKVDATRQFALEMADDSGGHLFGLGPATTASRLAWLSTSDSTLTGLGIMPSDITERLAAVWSDPRNDSSSAASPFFTWLGLYGDVGLFGTAMYCAAWWVVWRSTPPMTADRTSKAIIVLLFALGLLFNWMEEPALMATAALLIGASVGSWHGAEKRNTVVW